jgi:hypothetical protein
MCKVTASDPDVPQCGGEHPDSDFMLNPAILKMIGGAIKAASGLTAETMFQTPEECYETTIRWALNELIEACGSADQVQRVKKVKSYFEKVMADIRQAKEY